MQTKTCPYCKPDARGHHAPGCPNRPKNSFVAVGEIDWMDGVRVVDEKGAGAVEDEGNDPIKWRRQYGQSMDS